MFDLKFALNVLVAICDIVCVFVADCEDTRDNDYIEQ